MGGGIYLNSKEITTPVDGSTELSSVMLGTSEIWPTAKLNTYYDYGDGSKNTTVNGYGTSLYIATSLDAVPVLVSNTSSKYTQRGNCTQGNYGAGLVWTLKDNVASKTTIYNGADKSGTLTVTPTDASSKQINYFFGYTNDEGADSMCKTEVQYGGAWHTLTEAIDAKMIKPLVPISASAESWKSGTLSTIMTGGSFVYKDYTGFSAIIVQANEGVTSCRCTAGYWERAYVYWWECVNGRITTSANTYKKSQYGQDWW
jgi:hypothetical protein